MPTPPPPVAKPHPTLTLSGQAATRHDPIRPGWACVCGQQWPCPAARADLLIAYAGDRPRLAAHMAGLLDQAIRDGVPEQQRPRFLAWSG